MDNESSQMIEVQNEVAYPLGWRIFARFFSNLLHPFFIPTVCAMLLFYCHPYTFANMLWKQKVLTVFIVFAFTSVYPAIAIIIMYKLNMISGVNLRNRKDRIIPYVVVLTFYTWIVYMSLKPGTLAFFPNNFLFSHLMLALLIAGSFSFVGNNFLKVSMHMLGQGGLAGFIFFTAAYAQMNMQSYFLLSIIGAGLVGTSRIILKAHTLPEVYTGFMIGFFSQFVAFVVFPWLGIFS